MATLIHFFFPLLFVCVMKLKRDGGGPIVARTLMEEPEAAKEKNRIVRRRV
jgi:hypothetical protein